MSLYLPPLILSVVGLGGGLPQLWNLRADNRAKRYFAAATILFCAIFSANLVFVALTYAPETEGGSAANGAIMALSGVSGLGVWTAGLMWGGPVTRADRLSWIGGASAIGLFILAAITGVVQ